MKISDLPNKEFKTTIIKFSPRSGEQGMNQVKILSTNIENGRMHQTEITQLENTVTELKSSTERIAYSTTRKSQWPGIQYAWKYPVRSARRQKNGKEGEACLGDLWATMKINNLYNTGISEGKEKGTEDDFKGFLSSASQWLNEDGENNIRNSIFDMLTFKYLIQVEIWIRKARYTSPVNRD